MLRIPFIIISLLIGSHTSLNPTPLFDKLEISEPTFEENFFFKIESNIENIAIETPSVQLLGYALKGYKIMEQQELTSIDKPLVLVDFSLPSTENRLWVIEMQTGLILHHGLVSHGRNSGNLLAESFSNENNSYMSSLGFYLTGETYQGKHGHSLRLDGLEENFNDNARERAIVIHGADYANESFIQQTGRLGRSLGCPALPTEVAHEIIELIKEGSCLFIYSDKTNYLQQSPILNS